jgi:hypothetical protein
MKPLGFKWLRGSGMGRVCSTLAEDAKWLQNFGWKTELKEMSLRGWGHQFLFRFREYFIWNVSV